MCKVPSPSTAPGELELYFYTDGLNVEVIFHCSSLCALCCVHKDQYLLTCNAVPVKVPTSVPYLVAVSEPVPDPVPVTGLAEMMAEDDSLLWLLILPLAL